MASEREVVSAFLGRCNEYARASIARKQERGEEEDIAKWEAYIEFNEHALEEINNGTLDRWFPQQQPAKPPAHRHETDAMEHGERSLWLNAVLSPRPVVVAVTMDNNGRRNVAPLSSLMAVSTAPPYLTASFSIHKDGRHRDTLVNARSTSTIVFNFMPATARGVQIVDETATPLPHGEDEGLLGEIKMLADHPMVLNEAVAAIEAVFVEEHALPQAVAKLAVFRATAVWSSEQDGPEEGLNVLCQHGRDLMTPAPDGWTHRVTKHYG